MYLIIDNVTAIIRNMGEQIQYQSNGYPVHRRPGISFGEHTCRIRGKRAG